MFNSSIFSRNFNELDRKELYDLLALRTDIFVVEQNCPYPELDYHDQQAQHILLYSGRTLAAYARALPPGSVYKEPSIGRVAVKVNFRGKGLARKVFEMALSELENSHPKNRIKLQAQRYLEGFYSEYGFKPVTEPYADYGIMHVDMIREPLQT